MKSQAFFRTPAKLDSSLVEAATDAAPITSMATVGSSRARLSSVIFCPICRNSLPTACNNNSYKGVGGKMFENVPDSDFEADRPWQKKTLPSMSKRSALV